MKIYLVEDVSEPEAYVECAFSSHEKAEKYLLDKGYEKDEDGGYFNRLHDKLTLDGVVIEFDEWYTWKQCDPRFERLVSHDEPYHMIREMELM